MPLEYVCCVCGEKRYYPEFLNEPLPEQAKWSFGKTGLVYCPKHNPDTWKEVKPGEGVSWDFGPGKKLYVRERMDMKRFKKLKRYVRAVVCPYHDEQEPSMVVDFRKRSAYCFGCKREYPFEEVMADFMEGLDKVIDDMAEQEQEKGSDFITNEQGEPEMLINPSKEEFLQQLSGSIYQVDEKRDNITIPYRIFQKMLEFLREDC